LTDAWRATSIVDQNIVVKNKPIIFFILPDCIITVNTV